MRFFYILLSFILLTTATSCGSIQKNENEVLTGAIRWDAWCGSTAETQNDSNPGFVVEQTLGSRESYHYRLPFYSSINFDMQENYLNVSIKGNTQEVMDKEIQYAHDAGIDYWAILWYKPPMDYGRMLLKSSEKKDLIKWCYIFDGNWLNAVSGAEETAVFNETIQDMISENYQRTADGKPIVYIFEAGMHFKEKIDILKFKLQSYDIEPYIIGMTFYANNILSLMNDLGCDAISSYATPCGYNEEGFSFESNANAERGKWEGFLANAERFEGDVVPTVTSGWDKRPRSVSVGYATPWEPDSNPDDPNYDCFHKNFVLPATPSELTDLVRDAIVFVKENEENAKFKSILIYAWNEFDEGGYICPTLFELEKDKTPTRLNAVAQGIKAGKEQKY